MIDALPEYQCHKRVRAMKIADILIDPAKTDDDEDKITLTSMAPGIPGIEVDRDYLAKHQPQPGGYLVVYEGGYMSYSPAEAFESGYTAL